MPRAARSTRTLGVNRVAVLRFIGVVRPGIGKFAKQLELPKRESLSTVIRDWPDVPQPGTLNVRVQDGFPAEFIAAFGQPDVRLLDSRRFAPEAELNWQEIGSNTLPPQPNRPDRGNAQVWRATLRNLSTGAECLCWALRRIGSGLSVDFELVAGDKLRERLALSDGTPVEIDLEGQWIDT
jgi:hypothetical protein